MSDGNKRLAEGFDAYLGDLRHRHRPKTKLLRLLDEAGLTDPTT